MPLSLTYTEYKRDLTFSGFHLIALVIYLQRHVPRVQVLPTTKPGNQVFSIKDTKRSQAWERHTHPVRMIQTKVRHLWHCCNTLALMISNWSTFKGPQHFTSCFTQLTSTHKYFLQEFNLQFVSLLVCDVRLHRLHNGKCSKGKYKKPCKQNISIFKSVGCSI